MPLAFTQEDFLVCRWLLANKVIAITLTLIPPICTDVLTSLFIKANKVPSQCSGSWPRFSCDMSCLSHSLNLIIHNLYDNARIVCSTSLVYSILSVAQGIQNIVYQLIHSHCGKLRKYSLLFSGCQKIMFCLTQLLFWKKSFLNLSLWNT